MRPYVPLPMPDPDDVDAIEAWCAAEQAHHAAWYAAADRQLARLMALNSYLAIAVPTLIAGAALWYVATRRWGAAVFEGALVWVQIRSTIWIRTRGERRRQEYERKMRELQSGDANESL